MRERRLLAALERGERSREALLAEVWDDVPAEVRPAAAMVMEAHLESSRPRAASKATSRPNFASGALYVLIDRKRRTGTWDWLAGQ